MKESETDDPLARAVGDADRLRTLVATRDPGNPTIHRWDVRLIDAEAPPLYSPPQSRGRRARSP